MQYDLEYIEHVSFGRDLKILFKTVEKAFIKQEGITEEGSVRERMERSFARGRNMVLPDGEMKRI